MRPHGSDVRDGQIQVPPRPRADRRSGRPRHGTRERLHPAGAPDLRGDELPPGGIVPVVEHQERKHPQARHPGDRVSDATPPGVQDATSERPRHLHGPKQIGADQTQMVTFVLEPPEPVTSFLYRCDSKFYTAPLHEMLTEKDLYGLLVIDWSEATLGMLRGKRIEVIKNLQSQVPSKHRMGGQSARRFERGHDIAVHEWYKKIGELLTEAFLSQADLSGILIGGPGYSKEEFATGDYVHHELKKKVLPSLLDTGYTDEYGLRELVEKSREILSGLDLMREKSLVQRLMEEIRKADGGLAAYGEDQVRHALQLGAVETLLVSEGLRKSRLRLRCANGDWEGEKTVSEDGELPTCPKDGGALTVVENRDLIEDLSATAEGMGTSVELISKDSEEGQLLLRAFGGIAAILRYRVT